MIELCIFRVDDTEEMRFATIDEALNWLVENLTGADKVETINISNMDLIGWSLPRT